MMRSLRFALRYRFARQKELFSVVNSVLHPGICYMTHVSEDRFKFLKKYGIDEMVVSSSIKDHQIGEDSELRFIDPDFQQQARDLWKKIYDQEKQRIAQVKKEKISELEREEQENKKDKESEIPSTRRAIAWKNLVRDEEERIFPKITDPELHKTLFGYPIRKKQNQNEQTKNDQIKEEDKTEESDLETTQSQELPEIENETQKTEPNQQDSIKENQEQKDDNNKTKGKTACLDIGCLAGVDLSQMRDKFPNIKIKELRCKNKVQILEEVDVSASLLKIFLTAKVDKRIEKLSIQYDSYKSFHTKNETTMPMETRQKSAEIEVRLKNLKKKRNELELGLVNLDQLLLEFKNSGLTMVEFENKSLLEVFESRRARLRKMKSSGKNFSSLWSQHNVEEDKFKEYMIALQALVERFNTKFEKIDHPGILNRISFDLPIKTHIEAMNQYIGLFLKNLILDEWSLEQILRNTEVPIANVRFLVEYFQMYLKKYKESIKKFPGPNKIPERDYTDRTNEQLLAMIEENERETIKTFYRHFQEKMESGDKSRKGKLIQEIQKEMETGRFPESIEKMFEEKIKDLREMKDNDAEFATLKTVLETFLKLPFGIYTKTSHTLEEAKQILNESHYGMDELKKRVLQILAISKLRSQKQNSINNESQIENEEETFTVPDPTETETKNKKIEIKENPTKILCLHGPPGTGKTSVAKAIAESYGRKFARISLGGDNDVNLIKGHHRGYVSAQPGKIIKAMKQAGSMNPVILLDEVDKISGVGYQGGIYDVLLEVLDPVQNFQFKDNFMEEPIDLSQVLFVCSANVVSGAKMGQAFVDRMELIEVGGYTLEEKKRIFKDFIFPKNLLDTGLVKSKDDSTPEIECEISENIISEESDVTKNIIDSKDGVEISKNNPTNKNTENNENIEEIHVTKIVLELNENNEQINAEEIERKNRLFNGNVVKVEFTEEAILTMINDYSREPGVRGIKKLSRKIMDKVAQHVAVTLVENRSASELEFDFSPKETGVVFSDGSKEILYQIEPDHVNNILGQSFNSRDSLYPAIMRDSNEIKKEEEKNENAEEIIRSESISDDLVGVTMMPMSYFYGGSIDFVEIVELPQEKKNNETENVSSPTPFIDSTIENIIYQNPDLFKHNNNFEQETSSEPSKIQITGSAGKILKETVNASVSFARHFLYRSFNSKFLDMKSLHVHFPAGGNEIDCPSAGLAVVSSLISLALKQQVRTGVAMAGEVSLNGKVSGVNGLKERLLAMKREGITELVLSEENRGEVDDFKDNIKEGIQFHFVKDYLEAFSVVFKNE